MSSELTYAQMLLKTDTTESTSNAWTEDDDKKPTSTTDVSTRGSGNAWTEDDNDNKKPTSTTDVSTRGSSNAWTEDEETTTSSTSPTITEEHTSVNQKSINQKLRNLAQSRPPPTAESKYSKERFYSWNEFDHRRALRLKDICTFTRANDGIFLVESDFGKYEWSRNDNSMTPFNGTFLQWCYFRKVFENYECVGKRTIRDMCCSPDTPPVSIPKPPMSNQRRSRRRRRPYDDYNNNNYRNQNNYNNNNYNNNNYNNNNYNGGGGGAGGRRRTSRERRYERGYDKYNREDRLQHRLRMEEFPTLGSRQ